MESIKQGLKNMPQKSYGKNAQKVLLGSSDVKPETTMANSFFISQDDNWRSSEIFLAWKLLKGGELARQRVGWSFDVFRSSRYCHRFLRRQKPDESSFFRLLPLFRRRAQRAAVSVAQSAFHSLGGIKTSSYDFYQLGLDRIDVYFCPHIFRDVSKELIFAPHSLSSSWCFRKVK